jgi:hypothetical protein
MKKFIGITGFMKGFSCISNIFTHLSTPIEDPILLKSSELYSILFDKYEVSV